MLNHGLAGAERPRHAGRAAFGNRKERVDGALTRNQRFRRRQFFGIRTRAAYRPLLHEGNVADTAVFAAQFAHGFVHREFTRMNLGNNARFSGRHHDFVADGFSFGNISVNIAAGDHIAIGKRRLKIPTALAG